MGNSRGPMIRGRRRALVAGLVLTGWVFGQATVGVPHGSAAGAPSAATPTAASAASAATPSTGGAARLATPSVAAAPMATAAPPATTMPVPATRGGSDAPWLRFGLILMLGVALSGGAVMQYRATADAPPYEPKPRRTRRAAPTLAPATYAPTTTPAPVVQATGAPSAVERAPVFSVFPRQAQPATMPAPQARPQPLRLVEDAPTLTHAEERCTRAIAAAHRYDRPGTLAAFGEALDADPTLKPSALPDFWEMPAGGHADLALAYLRREQRLDARSVVSLALLTFPHNRELTALLREIDPYRLDRPA